MLTVVLFYLLIIHAAAVVIMLADKQKAKKNLWRIPESTLLTIAALGGSIGILLGMHFFRHKTRKPKFYLGVPAILATQAAVIWLLFSYIT